MKTNPKPKAHPLAPTAAPAPVQEHLRFDLLEVHKRVPAESRAECIALLRELIESVAGRPGREKGGAND